MFLILMIVYVAGLMVSLVMVGYHWDDEDAPPQAGLVTMSFFWPLIVAIVVPAFVVFCIFGGPVWLGRAIKNRRAGQRRA